MTAEGPNLEPVGQPNPREVALVLARFGQTLGLLGRAAEQRRPQARPLEHERDRGPEGPSPYDACPTWLSYATRYSGEGLQPLRDLVVRSVAALGRRQPAALRGDRAALDAVGRRDLQIHRRALELLASIGHLLEHLVRKLVDLSRAHVAPHQGELERNLLLQADVVRRVVARGVPRGEDARELVERVLAVGFRIRPVAVADEDVDRRVQ